MHIVPTGQSTEYTPPGALFIHRMARADGCPDCCENTETPYRIEIEGLGFTAYYGCESCGHFWHTAWTD